MTDEANQPINNGAEKPLYRRGLRKGKAVLGFVWWMVRVIDWLTTPKGLNRLEFPQYNGGRDLGDHSIQTLGLNERKKGSS
jgi:hypothetical protein